MRGASFLILSREGDEALISWKRKTMAAGRRFATVGAVLAAALCVLVLSLAADGEGDRGESRRATLLSDAAKQRLKEAVSAAGKAPSPKERAKVQHMLMPIANHIATRLLYTEVCMSMPLLHAPCISRLPP